MEHRYVGGLDLVLDPHRSPERERSDLEQDDDELPSVSGQHQVFLGFVAPVGVPLFFCHEPVGFEVGIDGGVAVLFLDELFELEVHLADAS